MRKVPPGAGERQGRRWMNWGQGRIHLMRAWVHVAEGLAAAGCHISVPACYWRRGEQALGGLGCCFRNRNVMQHCAASARTLAALQSFCRRVSVAANGAAVGRAIVDCAAVWPSRRLARLNASFANHSFGHVSAPCWRAMPLPYYYGTVGRQQCVHLRVLL